MYALVTCSRWCSTACFTAAFASSAAAAGRRVRRSPRPRCCTPTTGRCSWAPGSRRPGWLLLALAPDRARRRASSAKGCSAAG